MPARSLRITGHVQGVFFRATAEEMAKELGLTGWAKNMPDGSVEMHIEGEPEAVQEFCEWCNEGPSGAKVEHVDISDAEEEGHGTFEIIFEG
jgi:acylphosphatase